MVFHRLPLVYLVQILAFLCSFDQKRVNQLVGDLVSHRFRSFFLALQLVLPEVADVVVDVAVVINGAPLRLQRVEDCLGNLWQIWSLRFFCFKPLLARDLEQV